MKKFAGRKGWAVLAAVVGALVGAPAQADEGWRNVTPAWTWPRGGLVDIAATGPGDVWAVGFQGESCFWYTTIGAGPNRYGRAKHCVVLRKPVIQHWDGVSWSKFTPGPWEWSVGEVRKVIALGPGNVYFYGPSTSGNVLVHWNGREFRTVPEPPTPCGDGLITDDGQSVWSAGHGPRACRWDGSAWSSVPAPDGESFGSLQGIGPGGVWIARYTDRNYPLRLARWTGSAWQDVAVVADAWNPGDGVSSLSPVGPDDVWYVRTRYSSGVQSKTWVHWDGTSLTETPAPLDPVRPVNDDRVAFSRDSSGATVAATGYGAALKQWRFNGTTWDKLPSIVPPVPAGYVVNKIFQLPGTSTLWAVGEGVEDVLNPRTDPLVMTNG